MISDAQRAKIRRLFFAEHWKVGTIAAELGLHHDTVHLAIETRSFLALVLRAARRCSIPTPYIRFDRNDYSVPHTQVRKTVSVVASETLVRVLDGTTEIARHSRSYDADQQLEDERHLAALTADKRKAREHRGRNRLFAVCAAAQAFLAEIALHGGHLGGTTSRLLRLLDLYGAPALDTAIRDAHARGAFRAESVAHVLDQRRRADGAKPIISIALPDDPRVRDQVVHPHRLDAYDNLAARAGKKDDDE